MSRGRQDQLQIAVVAPMLLPVPPQNAGGTERVIHDLIRGVIKLGHKVALFGPLDSRVDGAVEGPSVSVAQLRETHSRVPGATLPVLEAALLDQVRQAADRFDAIHLHTEFAHAAVLHAVRPRTLTTVHWRCDELDRQLFFKAFPDLPVAAISADQAKSIPASNLQGIVHHGFEVDRYRAGPGSADTLAFLGRMTDQKRPEWAIELARRTDMGLKLAGNVDGGNPEHFRNHVEPHLDAKIEYCGEVDDRGKQNLFGHAAALVLPVDWPEPFGLVMIEAMACGTPVIAWNRGAVPEVIEHGVTGFVVDSMDEAEQAVSRLGEIDRTVVRKRFETRFSADRMARDYVRIYERLARR